MKSEKAKSAKDRSARQSTKSKTSKLKKKSWWQTTILALVVLIAIFVIFITPEAGRKLGLWGEYDSVRYFKQDPLARLNLPGLKLVHTEQTEDQGLAKKKSPAYVTRWFMPANGQSFEQAKADLIKYAEQHGWTKNEELSTDELWLGAKLSTLDSANTMRLRIKILNPYDEYDLYKSPDKLLLVSIYYI